MVSLSRTVSETLPGAECTRTITRSLQLFVQLIAWRQPHWLLIGHRSDSTRYPRSRCERHTLLSCEAKNQCKAPGDRSLVILEYPRDT